MEHEADKLDGGWGEQKTADADADAFAKGETQSGNEASRETQVAGTFNVAKYNIGFWELTRGDTLIGTGDDRLDTFIDGLPGFGTEEDESKITPLPRAPAPKVAIPGEISPRGIVPSLGDPKEMLSRLNDTAARALQPPPVSTRQTVAATPGAIEGQKHPAKNRPADVRQDVLREIGRIFTGRNTALGVISLAAIALTLMALNKAVFRHAPDTTTSITPPEPSSSLTLSTVEFSPIPEPPDAGSTETSTITPTPIPSTASSAGRPVRTQAIRHPTTSTPPLPPRKTGGDVVDPWSH